MVLKMGRLRHNEARIAHFEGRVTSIVTRVTFNIKNYRFKSSLRSLSICLDIFIINAHKIIVKSLLCPHFKIECMKMI